MSKIQRQVAAPESAVTPAALTRGIGRELASLAALSAEIQLALSLCHFAEHTDASAIRGLQGIDRITQSLDDLARLLRELAAEMPNGSKHSAAPLLTNLRLRDLRLRLSSEDAASTPAAMSGEVLWL